MKGLTVPSYPSNSRSTPATDLTTPIQFLKGVGPSRADVLAKVGITTVEDLLYYFPRDHQDRRVIPLKSATAGAKQSFLVTIQSASFSRAGKMLGRARAIASDDSSNVEAVWFKRLTFKYDVFSGLKRDLVPGQRMLLYGTVDHSPTGLTLQVEDQEVFAEGMDLNRIVPVYPLTEGLGDRWLRSLMARVVPEHAARLTDPLPSSFRSSQGLPPFAEAVQNFHFPDSWNERDRARERLAFDEFFFLELALAINRQERGQIFKGQPCVIKRHLLTPFKSQLGFEFTKSQTHVINEIFRDMQQPTPMNRLLQGDVGSGKTVVALSAALLAIENGRQVAFLAPTEILAQQHALSFARIMTGLPVKTAVLMGSSKAAERKERLARLAAGRIDILVGTHAILSDEVKFKDLGLVIVDEQHRFGVRQRAKLQSKSLHPDVLIMTATPIPRTLALTLYGDLDVSVMEASPAGRTPIRTQLVGEATAFQKIKEAVDSGRQAYVVFPLVEESEQLSKRAGKNVQAATKEFEKIERLFPGFKVGLLHGQMKPGEKSRVMDQFRGGELSILVATPVIEVGIDVANASLIAIVNPERFGLSQLHQLRGRVGRGAHASECLLVVSPEQTESEGRLSVFASLSDGFRLAEEDLRMRGPGEILGEAQHGLPAFRVGDLIKDGLLIARTREAALSLVRGEFSFTLQEFGMLNKVLVKRFGTKLQFSRVG